MKKIIVLSLIVALVAGVPAFAAGVDFGGSIETKIEVNKKGEDVTVNPGSELSLNLGINAAEDKLRAGVEFGLEEDTDKDLMVSGINLGDINLKQAFIEADGSFWYGGPEATTRFGTLNIGYSPYASLKDRSGISVSGLDLDVIGLNGFYALKGENGHVLGFRSDINVVDELALGGSVIRDAGIIRVQADADANPIEGLNVQGRFAADHTEDSGWKMDNLWTVKADYDMADVAKVVAGYKYITEDWEPRYIAAQSGDDEDDQEQDWVYLDKNKNHGMFVGLETSQQGVNMHASYDQMFAEAKIGADTEYEGFTFDVNTVLEIPTLSALATKSTTFGVGREVAIMDGFAIDARYEGEWKGQDRKLVHTLGAKTTLGIVPAVNGLELSAEVSASELALDSIGYKVGAEFAAPNGVNLGIEHARHEGTTFNAGMKVEF